MKNYIGNYKLNSIASFDDDMQRKYISVEEYINAGSDEDEKKEHSRTVKQLGWLQVNEDGTANYKCRLSDFGMTKDHEEIKKGLDAGVLKLLDEDFFMIAGEKDTIHWEVRGDDLYMDIDRNEEGPCFTKVNIDGEDDGIEMMIML